MSRANLSPTTTKRKSWCCCLPLATTKVILSQWRPPSIGGQATSCTQAQPIINYNHKMGGVDTADQMVRYYSCRRKTYRWNIRVLYDMIDIAALNGYKTYSAFNKGDRIEYLNKLSRDLMAYKCFFFMVWLFLCFIESKLFVSFKLSCLNEHQHFISDKKN
ncbi:hypothetical protein EIN_271250 [Entamoeba invadens IP1]|uniref:PiggyBac transposable element-derived protein domain-containing protein n=1 Tax=Entamoeba invadens IP1 TaxID=370355 RepID=A0A0A1U6D3_ENTIV|nr:hypothetical protein EIN_271250 [Entamoeba invadens IP1]ELP89850.1 hypothetical protein EIN_271250 [Entamoeba invadens IP1]|eukprot:XP_004256621.1 hypothetical protein EIN_271250 [Entamoeba invadens IP1]